jgi:hypothetical protein
MDLCQTSYALGNISAARSSLRSAGRALERDRSDKPTAPEARALLAVHSAVDLLEAAIHELGSDIAAHQLALRNPV